MEKNDSRLTKAEALALKHLAEQDRDRCQIALQNLDPDRDGASRACVRRLEEYYRGRIAELGNIMTKLERINEGN